LRLARLSVAGIRIIESAELEPGPRINVLVGANAQGKTSLLEAIGLLVDGRSFRSPRAVHWLRRGATSARVRGEVLRADGLETRLELHWESGRRQFLVNGRAVPLDEYVGRLAVVVFTVEHLGIADGGPRLRRSFLDRGLFGIYPAYLATARTYQRILRQRNQLLRGGGADKELEPWTEQLVRAAVAVVRRRLRYVELLRESVGRIHTELTAGAEELELRYRHSWGENHHEGLDVAAALRQALERMAPQERVRGVTLVGPHRDDLLITLNGRSLRTYGSRGQQRSTVISLKLAELDVFRRVTGENPVLLLDDVASELDPTRCKALFSAVQIDIQAFITTTDYDKIPPLAAGCRKIVVEKGRFEVAN
jgi:DNA replication and repair protein RecF